MSTPLPFLAVGRLPAPGDNAAIAIRRLEAGTVIAIDGVARPLAHTILEGHRFAVRPIAPGEPLLSWGLPFGHAMAAIAPGDYVCNQSILEALAMRQLGITLPDRPNFADHLVPFELDAAAFRPGPPVKQFAQPRTFSGYRRPGTRGVGTRNTIVILGTTSRTASFARQLAARSQALARVFPALDGIVAVAHTEGGGPGEPNNAAEVLRALAGFIVHPNVGAVLAVDHGVEPVNNERLRAFMRERGYPLDDVPHAFLSVRHGLAVALGEGEAIVRRWLPVVAAQHRTNEPLSGLRIALQCGGSDAFNGVSGNPLAGAVVHEVVRHGGTGVLCETDELSGAEAYLVKNVRDLPTVRALLGWIAAFRARLSWHGVNAESNPSGGNKLRGLYNITLKSLGAVHKKDPRTRIDHVIDYAEPLGAPGFYFMNSPGNDLEGIAGHINAGRYLDGESMERLTAEAVDLVIATASGQRTRGEHAGHSQTSLWRNWRQTDGSHLAEIRARPVPDGKPLSTTPLTTLARGPLSSPLRSASFAGQARREPISSPLESGGPEGRGVFSRSMEINLFPSGSRYATERVGLILPTSMCSAQIARLAATRMNETALGHAQGIERFVALAHTEGCGFGGESMYQLLQRTYHGYVTHPNVAAALLLEHGCEKVPNDAMRRTFETAGLPLVRFGWASVQLDGGIEKSLARIAAWFEEASATMPPTPRVPVGLEALHVALLSAAPMDAATAGAFARVAAAVITAGGSVLLPESDPLLASPTFQESLLGPTAPHATLAYGQAFTQPGLHVVATDTDHWDENLAGLGACGAHLFVGLIGDSPRQAHPLLPVLQVATTGTDIAREDVDLALTGDATADAELLLRCACRTAAREYVPVANAGGFVDFQLSRGLLGVST